METKRRKRGKCWPGIKGINIFLRSVPSGRFIFIKTKIEYLLHFNLANSRNLLFWACFFARASVLCCEWYADQQDTYSLCLWTPIWNGCAYEIHPASPWVLHRVVGMWEKPAAASFISSHECYNKCGLLPWGRWVHDSLIGLEEYSMRQNVPEGSRNDDRDTTLENCLWQWLGRGRGPVRSSLWGDLDVEG